LNIALGITGSIAAYKSLELIRLLRKSGAEVKVVLTKSASHFVTPLSCQTLSANEVYMDQFLLTKGMKHLALSAWADVLVVAPATANIIGKAACGIGDDLLTTALLSFQKPILFVPAMDSDMWANEIVRENVSRLRKAGFHILEPSCGALASGKIGKGRFPSVSIIQKKILVLYEKHKPLDQMRFLVSGGRTEEDIDPVRMITNRSSGRMARELLYAITCRGGIVKGVIGEVTVDFPEDMDITYTRTSDEMLKGLKANLSWCDCLIMAAAVGDYRPEKKKTRKIHDRAFSLRLEKNQDLLKKLIRVKSSPLVVGFSLEDSLLLARGKKKLTSKKCDMIILNSYSAVASETTHAKILKKDGKVISFGKVTKWQLANRILDECIKALGKRRKKRKYK